MQPEELLERMARTLRSDIAPAIADPYPKTQAFMASVILEKLARQLRLADAHARADREDQAALVDDLARLVGSATPPRLTDTLKKQAADEGAAALGQLVEALYAERDELGPQRFDELLGRVRRTLRARLDRQLEYAS